MNYIKQILAFYDKQMLNPLSTGEIALWHALMHINNKTGWSEWFTVANLTLQSLSGLSRSGINKDRNVLKQNGFIDFKTKGTKATSYRVINLVMSNSNQVSVQDGSQSSNQGSNQNGNQDSVQNSSSLNKQNKTKQNETKDNMSSSDEKNLTARKTIEYLNKKADKHYRFTQANLRIINTRLNDGFTLNDLQRVIDTKTAQWLNNPKMQQYLRPATLFNASKFEGYLNENVPNQQKGSDVDGLF